MKPENENAEPAGGASAGSETNETPEATASGEPRTEDNRGASSSTPPATGAPAETAGAPDDDEPGLPVDHTPIIITGGSAAIEYDNTRYTRAGTTNRVNSNAPLRIRSLAFVNVANPTRRHFCYMPRPGMRYVIQITCQRTSQPDEMITIRGGPGLGPNEIEFSHSEFQENAAFPPQTEHGRRQGNTQRRITGLTVTEIPPSGPSTTLHVCDLIPASGVCRFEMDDRA